MIGDICTHCKTETVRFDSFNHEQNIFCGSCLAGLLNPKPVKMALEKDVVFQ